MEKNKTLSRDRLTGVIMFFMLTALSVSGIFFHEPWFDEIQAYLIARDASFHDIFFVLPHYEGHPPLWHILLLPAKLGLSCRPTLIIAQIVTYAGFLAMLELRSPFGWKLKLFFSCSYYLVFQYGVISRPYAMLMLAALLVADFYPERDKKPFRYLLAMLFMCLCHSYGIAIAGGFAATDLIRRFIQEKYIPGVIKNTGKKLFASYCLLLAAAILIMLEISPRSNTGGIHMLSPLSFFKALFFSAALMPSESFITSFINDDEWLQTTEPVFYEIAVGFLFSAIIWYSLIMICKKRKMLAEFFTINGFFILLTAIYSMPHHFGIFAALVIMFLWIAQKREPLTISELTTPFEKTDNFRIITKYSVKLFITLTVVTNLYWNIHCFNTDRKKLYDAGIRTAEWVKENDLENKKILGCWNENTTKILTYGTISTNAFLEHNLFMNSDRGLTYCTHVVATDEEYEEDIEWMRSMGSPEVIFTSSISIEDETEALGLKDKYSLCYRKANVRTFKDKAVTVYTVVFVRSDLADSVEKCIE